MRVRVKAAVAALAFAAFAMPAHAHHVAGIEYDTRHSVALRGAVMRVEWRLPHVVLYITAEKSDGSRADWTILTLGPAMLEREGLHQSFLKVGDIVDMRVCLAKDGSQRAVTRSIQRPDGTPTFVRVGGC
jgi:Family of unknown function (DUF6152)